jgi:hypothetical protein
MNIDLLLGGNRRLFSMHQSPENWALTFAEEHTAGRGSGWRGQLAAGGSITQSVPRDMLICGRWV